MADPVSWLQIQQGWAVTFADDVPVGTVAQIEGDPQEDIFDGLAISAGAGGELQYIPGEQVGSIYPGEVTLKIASSARGTLEPFRPAPPETKWTPGKAPLGARISNWFRGRR
jgi:hypothetical protein